MNHIKIYESIITNAKLANREKLAKINKNYVYYENHHILPRCVGGGEEKENKVLLTAKEHFIVHKLLIYIYPNSRGLALALRRFLYSKKGGMIFSSRDYVFIKEAISLIPVTKETCEKLSKALTGKHTSEETRKKQSNAKKGKPSGRKGKTLSEETKLKISLKCKGYKHTEKTKEKFKGRIPWNKGKKYKHGPYKKKDRPVKIYIRSEEQRKNLSNGQRKREKIIKICPVCGKSMNFLNYGKHGHGDNCKQKSHYC